MMGDPIAKFYYPQEIYRFVMRGFVAGVTVGAVLSAAVAFLLR